MTLHAIAWDIDGTLVDSEPLHHRALVSVCARYGLRIAPDDQSFVGVHMGNVWDRLHGRFQAPVNRDQWYREIRAYYAGHSDGLVPIPGAAETIRTFAEAGVSQICVSNSDRAVVDANLQRLGIADLLIGSISLDDVPAGKPDPAPYRMAVELLGLTPQHVLAVEDSETGARSARTAGLQVAVLKNPLCPDISGADFTLADITQVTRIPGLLPR